MGLELGIDGWHTPRHQNSADTGLINAGLRYSSVCTVNRQNGMLHDFDWA